jgi:hypothetical protein
MTDDAYLILLDGTATTLGVPVTAVGTLACMETPAVRAWLDAQGVAANSPLLRILPPEETAAIPAGVERLPVPLSDDELSSVRNRTAPPTVSEIERELLAYRSCTDGRDVLLRRALAAGVPAHRIAELTGEDPVEVKSAVV